MLATRQARSGLCRQAATVTSGLRPVPPAVHRRKAVISHGQENGTGAPSTVQEAPSSSNTDLGKELNKFTRQTASTFAPRASTKTKNPAVKGSVLYNVFEAQAWISLAVGGLLSFNVLFPSNQPDIARLLGMWSIWMFTIPSLRAKECTPREKDALNVLFVGVPLLNVLLPFVWKSFAFIWVADTLSVLGVYYWKGVWQDVYGIPFMAPGALDTPVPGQQAAAEENGNGADAGQQ